MVAKMNLIVQTRQALLPPERRNFLNFLNFFLPSLTARSTRNYTRNKINNGPIYYQEAEKRYLGRCHSWIHHSPAQACMFFMLNIDLFACMFGEKQNDKWIRTTTCRLLPESTTLKLKALEMLCRTGYATRVPCFTTDSFVQRTLDMTFRRTWRFIFLD